MGMPPPDPARASESNTGWLLGVMGMSCALAVLFTGLRTYTRVFLAKLVSPDDYVMLVTAVWFGGSTLWKDDANMRFHRPARSRA